MTLNENKHSRAYGMGAGVIALLLFAYYIYTWRNAINFITAMDACSKAFCDFASFYYPMGKEIFHMRLPVQGFGYSPFIAILFSVIPPFGLNTSLILWGILQFASIILFLLLFTRLVPSGRLTQLLFIFLALSSFPLLHTLAWGQVGTFTVVAILGALFFHKRGHRLTAAVLLAFGLSFKFFPIIFLLPFILRRDIRFLLLAAAACSVFLIVIPATLLGIDDVIHFYAALLNSYRHFDWVTTNYNSQHFPHVLLRLIYSLGFDASEYLPLFRWIGYGVAVANAGLLYLIQRARLSHANLWSFHILFLTIPFILPTSWPVDLGYISFAQGLLTWHILEVKESDTFASRLPSLLMLLASIVVSNICFFNFLNDHILFGRLGFIFWSNLFLLAASYAQLLPIALPQIRPKLVTTCCRA
ncbi:MAG: DUF2029 domain-containing protein [Chloroflexi bacterium]|nr:DUF2029 domain-containing protein [Chloroflexota bacterium]